MRPIKRPHRQRRAHHPRTRRQQEARPRTRRIQEARPRTRKSSSSAAKQEFGDVVKVLKPLRDGGPFELHVRVIQTKRGRRLDIRQFVTEHQRYTRKGIFLSSEEWDALLAQRKKLSKLLAQ